ncbi:Sodium/calcium exchanger membrane region [Penicillium hetheringtonii]|uniref:Sodium/calcium exchanger membrane region n=1 Tax=Penicillium hetheringtonii TaxID=911720 RepID=A0AAD6H2S1_9EURO|nr:Sodium/calcium exchanger membrane region [Penicillium hetheringtonii]
MVTNGNAARNGHLHHNIGHEEESGLITDCASEHSFGSEHRFKKWSSNHQDPVEPNPRKDGVSHHARRLFHKSQSSADFRSRDRSLPVHGCASCGHPIIAFKEQVKVLLSFKNSISLIFALVAIAFSALNTPALVVFIWNLIAIVPLSITLTFATERLSQDLGETSGALLNISLGNLAELIIFTALMKNNIKVVQASLLGSVLVNLLLVLGSAIIAGGVISPDQTYNNDVTHSFVGLLNLTVSCLMIPSAFYGSVKSVKSADHMALNFSRGVSIILLIIYFLYLFFQFRSHPHIFRSRSLAFPVEHNPADKHTYRPSYDPVFTDIESRRNSLESTKNHNRTRPEMQEISSSAGSTSQTPVDTETGLPLAHLDSTERGNASYHGHSADQFSETDESHYCRNSVLAGRTVSLFLLTLSTVLIAMCAEFFASSFEVLNDRGVLGESFVGLIIIPIAGNVAENVTAVVVAAKNQMDLAISVALGSAIQIGLLVAPMIVLVGWGMGKPMSLHFDNFGMITLVGSSVLVSFIVLKGKTNYLEGAILCACFAAISVGAFLLPIA